MKHKLTVPVIGLFLLFYAACLQNATEKPVDIDPPFLSLSQPADTCSIDPSVEQVMHLKNGMSVEVPANAFVDEAGNAVKTPVTLFVTRYDTRAKIMASGIPMKYTENGAERDFESAGMFDIQGYSGAIKVKIANGKKLAVTMPSKSRGNYDFYYLEEQQGKKVTTAGFGPPGSDDNGKRKGTWKKLSANTAADRYDTSKTIKNFKLKFDTKEYPDLQDLSTINWHLATTFGDPTTADNNWVLNTEWSSLDITQPAYLLGDAVYKFPYQDMLDTVNNVLAQEYDRMWVSADMRTVAIFNHAQKQTTIWSERNQRAITIENAEPDNPWFTDNDHLLLKKGDDVCLYDLEGNITAHYGRSSEFLFFEKNDRVVYEHDADVRTGAGTIRIADRAGHVIKDYKLYDNAPNGFGYNFRRFTTADDSLLVIMHGDSANVCTLDGRPVASKKAQVMWNESVGDHTLLGEKTDGGLLAWNYQTGHITESKAGQINIGERLIGNTNYYGHAAPGPAPFVIVDEPSKDYSAPSKLWNYKTNEVTALDFHAVSYPAPPGVLYGNFGGGTYGFYAYDAPQQRKIIQIDSIYVFTDGGGYAQYSAKWKRLVLNSTTCVRLYSAEGKLIRDFRKFDTLIRSGGLIDSDRIFTYSQNGIYRLWDRNGNLRSTKVTDGGAYSYGFTFGAYFVAWDQIFQTYKIYDAEGNAVSDLGRAPMALLGKNKFVVTAKDGNGAILPYVPRKKHMYQLTLRTSTKEFQTNVYLDAETAQRLARYTGFRTMKMNEEMRRREGEESVLRRFDIDKFGIYNWDALLGNENNIVFAATFRFDVPMEYNNITVFCLSKFDGDIVIKFYQYLWNKFYIDPTRPNKLVAVLPGNKIAIFSEEDMKKVDWEQVKQTHTYTFNMKTVSQQIDNIAALNQFL